MVARQKNRLPCGYARAQSSARFNGIEKVNEVAGTGNHYTALFGEYDPRIVYRWNTDPVPVPWESPYVMFRDNPIWYGDPLLDYSRVGAWWRNAVNGGNGISKNEKTGEWGYDIGIPGGVAHRDGSREKMAKQWARDQKNHEFLSDIYKHSTGGNLE
ncbi:MAG TPA: hypothetical protein VL098_08305 [Flavipsychrobacter sp.]|nr:hypothetical protein [Flavipsychrobacter sp.]